METTARRTLRLTVPPSSSGARLDQYLGQSGHDISRGMARKVIDLGGVHMNGRRVRTCSVAVRAGDDVTVHIDGLPLVPFKLTDEHIVYRDRYLLVVAKPAGIDTQPTPSRYKGTLYAAALDYLKDPLRKDLQPGIGMVQRLDRETSGLIVFSIHPASHKGLSRAFSSRQAEKRYRAVVSGPLGEESGEFRSLLARRRATNTMKTVEKGGREAITLFRRIAVSGQASYVEVTIPTGRSHQIRAHFAEAGHPLLGDDRYGGPGTVAGMVVPRQMLHAAFLGFPHPKTGETLAFSLDLPYDMAMVVQRFFPELS